MIPQAGAGTAERPALEKAWKPISSQATAETAKFRSLKASFQTLRPRVPGINELASSDVVIEQIILTAVTVPIMNVYLWPLSR